MIVEVKMYTVECDHCGKDSNDNSEWSCWNDEVTADDVAMNMDWFSDDDKHYCTDCYSYGDNDELILKTK